MTTLSTGAELGRVKITVTTADGSLLTVQRKHPSGRILPVRGMDQAPLSGGSFIGWDYEAPINVPVVYIATTWADPDTVIGVSTPAPITWTTPNEWLKDPLEPIRNMTVNISDMSSYGYDTPTGVLTVLGRPEPVTVGQVRRAATGDVTFLTLNQEERDRLHYITASGHVLLLQSTQESGVGSMYIALMGVTENRVLPQRDEQERYFTVSYQEVAAPVGAGAPFSTWQDVIDQYPTWQAVIDANTSWFSLIENLGTTTAPPILAWRGA